MEKNLGEIDRARAIYMHLSQYYNPKVAELEERFWKVWEEFETMHGSEETYKDYLKIHRSTIVKYSIQETT
jgi:pre-mRNA-splicing factor SYF1